MEAVVLHAVCVLYYCLQVRTHSLSRPPSGHSHQGCHWCNGHRAVVAAA